MSAANGPSTPAELVDTLLEGGFKTRSPRKNFYVSCYAKLNDLKDDGTIEKVGKKWSISSLERAGLPD